MPLAPEERCPLGFSHLDVLTLGTYDFYNSTYSLNCGPSQNLAGQYQTDTIRDKALAYIEYVRRCRTRVADERWQREGVRTSRCGVG